MFNFVNNAMVNYTITLTLFLMAYWAFMVVFNWATDKCVKL